jgi:hypothetical protein
MRSALAFVRLATSARPEGFADDRANWEPQEHQ